MIFTVSVILVGWTEALATNASAAARPDAAPPLAAVVALPPLVVAVELTVDFLLLLHAAASRTIDTNAARPARRGPRSPCGCLGMLYSVVTGFSLAVQYIHGCCCSGLWPA